MYKSIKFLDKKNYHYPTLIHQVACCHQEWSNQNFCCNTALLCHSFKIPPEVLVHKCRGGQFIARKNMKDEKKITSIRQGLLWSASALVVYMKHARPNSKKTRLDTWLKTYPSNTDVIGPQSGVEPDPLSEQACFTYTTRAQADQD